MIRVFVDASVLYADNIDYLVTWDRKHLINPPEVAEHSGLRILTPGELMDSLRGKGP